MFRKNRDQSNPPPSNPIHLSSAKKIRKLANFRQNLSTNAKVRGSPSVCAPQDYQVRVLHPKNSTESPLCAAAINLLRTALSNYRQKDFTVFGHQKDAVFVVLMANPGLKAEGLHGDLIFGAAAVFRIKDFASLFGLGVSDLFSGNGFGRTLIQGCLDHFKCPLKTESGPGSVAFYEKMGFVRCATPYVPTPRPELQYEFLGDKIQGTVKAKRLEFGIALKELAVQWSSMVYCLQIVSKIDSLLIKSPTAELSEARELVTEIIATLVPMTKSEVIALLDSKFRETGRLAIIESL